MVCLCRADSALFGFVDLFLAFIQVGFRKNQLIHLVPLHQDELQAPPIIAVYKKTSVRL